MSTIGPRKKSVQCMAEKVDATYWFIKFYDNIVVFTAQSIPSKYINTERLYFLKVFVYFVNRKYI